MDVRLRLQSFIGSLRESLWVVPAASLLGAVLLSEVFTRFQILLAAPPWFEIGPDSARALLQTIGTATITLTGLVFSITMLVLQLASSQLSPSVMRSYLRDRTNQAVLGIFIATFAYTILVLRKVGTDAEGVPVLAVWLGVVLALLSVGAFVHYVNHTAQAVRPSTVMDGIARETREAITRLYPQAAGEPAAEEEDLPRGEPTAIVRQRGRGGVVSGVDSRSLTQIAQETAAVLEMIPYVGDFVPEGGPLFRVWGELSDETRERLQQSVIVSRDRSMQQDALFGFRQLVDIAGRALSPGVNDPTTAVEAIDHIHDLLRRLIELDLPSPYRATREDGALMLVLPRPSWEDYVALAMDEIRIDGRGSMQVQRRLRRVVEDLLSVCPPHRRPPLVRQQELLDAELAEGFPLPGDRESAAKSSAQGHGP